MCVYCVGFIYVCVYEANKKLVNYGSYYFMAGDWLFSDGHNDVHHDDGGHLNTVS